MGFRSAATVPTGTTVGAGCCAKAEAVNPQIRTAAVIETRIAVSFFAKAALPDAGVAPSIDNFDLGPTGAPLDATAADIAHTLYRRRFQERRSLMPGRSLPSFRIAVVEQRAEIRRIKFFVLHVREIGFDIGEVVIDAVALGRRIDGDDVVVAAVMDHRRDSSFRSATTGPSRIRARYRRAFAGRHSTRSVGRVVLYPRALRRTALQTDLHLPKYPPARSSYTAYGGDRYRPPRGRRKARS